MAGAPRHARASITAILVLLSVAAALAIPLPAQAAVPKAASSTVLQIDHATSVSGQAVVLTADVTSDAPPSGTVRFSVGATSLGTATLSAGSATLTTTKLPVGTGSLTAAYLGSATVLTSTSLPVEATVDLATTTTVVEADRTASFPGTAVALTATVTANEPGAPALTGLVTFTCGATALGAKSLVNGQAILSTTKIPVGTCPVTASYAGSTKADPSASAPVDVTVALAATTTVLEIDPAASSVGQTVTYRATVTPEAGAPVPTGTVTFTNGATVLGTKSLTAGVAALATTKAALGTGSVIASYAGSTKAAPSVSDAVGIEVTKLPTTTALAVSEPATAAGTPVTLTATVAPGRASAPAPTGTVAFWNGATKVGTSSLVGDTATFTTRKLAVGSLVLTATYNGSTKAEPSTSAPVDGTVSKTASTLELTADDLSPAAGDSVTVTARVRVPAPSLEPITGSVVIRLGTVAFRTLSLVGGVATFTTTASSTVPRPAGTLPTGPLDLRATYAGTARIESSAATAVPSRVATTITVTSSSSPATELQPVTFTATVTPMDATPLNAFIRFYDGDTLISTAIPSNGTATYTTGALGAGEHTITAAFAGDAHYGPATSAPFTQTMVPRPPQSTMSLFLLSPQRLYGDVPSLLLAVGPAAVTGTVTLTVDGQYLDSAELAIVAGTTIPQARFTATSFPGAPPLPGVHTLVATYSGDGTYPATSKSATFTVLPPYGEVDVQTGGDTIFGEAVTITATPRRAAGAFSEVPTGTVTFVLDGAQVGDPVTLVDGAATVTTSAFGEGEPYGWRTMHALDVYYSGDDLYPATDQHTVHVVRPVPGTGPSETTVVLGSTTVPYGTVPTITATVAPGDALGPIWLSLDDRHHISSTELQPDAGNGNTPTAVFELWFDEGDWPPPGEHTITVDYLGDGTYGPSSATVTFTVLPE